MIRNSRVWCWVCLLMLGVVVGALGQTPPPAVYPAAIFPFQEQGSGVRGYGEKISGILFASLAANPDLLLVDRAEMEKTLAEHELNLSGLVSPDQAVKVGQLIGAKLLITGSVIEADKTTYLVAKIIGTETSRVVGESVKGTSSDEIAPLAEQLAAKIAEAVKTKANVLIANPVKTEDRVAAINKALGTAKRPTVIVDIKEQHVGQAVIDPAAQTEIAMFCKETGFEVLNAESASEKKADVIIKGEGFSEFAIRRGNLISVKARLEVKAIDRATDKIIAEDRQTAVVVDLVERVAGKAALQEAAAAIAERMLPKLVAKP